MSSKQHLASANLLMKQFRELTDPRKAIPSFHITLDDDDIYHWNIGVMILSSDSPYHEGYFKAHMNFPLDYPFSPPKFRFTPPIYHPNVYKDGLICISILHRSGDHTSGEPDHETWSPAQSVESVLISIVSLLSDPNINSPANVDAAMAWKKDRESYNKRVAQDVAISRANLPKDFVMPVVEKAYVAPKSAESRDDMVEDDFWDQSDGDLDDESLMGEDSDASDNPDYIDDDDDDDDHAS